MKHFFVVFLNYGWNSPNVKLCLLNFLEHLSHKILTDNICSSERTMLQWAWGSDRLLHVSHVFLVLCSCKCCCPKSWSGEIAEIWRAANETFWRPDASSSSVTCSVHHLSFARVINESWCTHPCCYATLQSMNFSFLWWTRGSWRLPVAASGKSSALMLRPNICLVHGAGLYSEWFIHQH